MRDTLICTVGTSLLSNCKRLGGKIEEHISNKNWKSLTIFLINQDNTERICGAEINSITSICDEGLIQEKNRLIFLVSDTEDGKSIGQLLKQYYENSRNPIKFRQVEYRILTGLRDDNVEEFKITGLKNLVKEISNEVRKYSSQGIAINATGGYKAQISFAGMIGQALSIPVYYLFERFSKIIELPPQPIALDLGLWLNYYVFFEQLESEDIVKKSELSELEIDLENPVISTLIDELYDEEQQNYLVTFSAMGVLFNERCRLEFSKQEKTLLSLVPKIDTPSDQKIINIRDDHGKDTLEKFAKKLCNSPYVIKVINSLPFNPQQKTPIRRSKTNGIIEFVLTRTDAGLGICIQTTGRNLAETNTIALHLQEEFFQ